MPKPIRLYRWTGDNFRVGNFGDDISIPIIERLFSREVVPAQTRDADMIAAGSILDFYGDQSFTQRLKDKIRGSKDLHVWGTGVQSTENPILNWPQKMHFHAVRGELTAARIPGFRGALGDPGILASQLLDKRPAAESPVVFVPHFSDEAKVDGLDLPAGWRVVHADNEVLTVVEGIAKAELVVSSSLHGIIVADSLGIPVVWLSPAGFIGAKTPYKYEDYASSRQRPLNAPLSYEAAMAMTVQQLHDVSTTPARDVGEWQRQVAAAFPSI